MKKYLLFALALIVLFCLPVEAQLKMDSNGDVGIGYMSGDPAYKLQVRGTVSINPSTSCTYYFTNYYTSPILRPGWSNSAYIGLSNYKLYYLYANNIRYNSCTAMSDISIKENIRDIKSPLVAIRQVRGIQYDLKREYFTNSPEEKMDELVEEGKNKYGVIAQELKEVLPDLVVYDEEEKLYAVNYIEMIPILVEAIKEQQEQIEELQAAIESGEVLKGAAVSTTNPDLQSSEAGSSTLYQNAPNPFTNETTISYSLGEMVGSATLFIYDMSGKQLRSYNLHERGDSQINIIGGELDAGMYMYSLVADGLLIGTEQMLLTD
jgi:hypothetical protein